MTCGTWTLRKIMGLQMTRNGLGELHDRMGFYGVHKIIRRRVYSCVQGLVQAWGHILHDLNNLSIYSKQGSTRTRLMAWGINLEDYGVPLVNIGSWGSTINTFILASPKGLSDVSAWFCSLHESYDCDELTCRTKTRDVCIEEQPRPTS